MARIPSLRRTETAPAPAPAPDENRDGRPDDRDRRTGSDPVTETRTYRSRATAESADRDGDGRTATIDRDRTDRDRTDQVSADRPVPEQPAKERPVRERPGTATGTARPVTDRPGPTSDGRAGRDSEIAVSPGPKPRASLLATIGLITGVASALLVLTGTLAGYGLGLGVLASLLSIAGISATGRRHVAGKSDALIGLALGLGAMIVGILALTGQFAWPSTDADTVQRFREWLDSQFVDRV